MAREVSPTIRYREVGKLGFVALVRMLSLFPSLRNVGTCLCSNQQTGLA